MTKCETTRLRLVKPLCIAKAILQTDKPRFGTYNRRRRSQRRAGRPGLGKHKHQIGDTRRRGILGIDNMPGYVWRGYVRLAIIQPQQQPPLANGITMRPVADQHRHIVPARRQRAAKIRPQRANANNHDPHAIHLRNFSVPQRRGRGKPKAGLEAQIQDPGSGPQFSGRIQRPDSAAGFSGRIQRWQ